LLWLLAIVALTFAVYVPSLDNDFTNWDDTHLVTENPAVLHQDAHAILTQPVVGNYIPLTIASLALNYKMSGLDPRSYHWLNLLLHLANTALVFFFIRALMGGGLWAPAVCSLFFGIHPMHVESVAWITERKDVLYAFFFLLGLLAYLRFLDRRQYVWLGAAFVAFALSLASKPAAMVFPLVLLAIDWYRRRPINLPGFLEKAPFLILSIIDGILTLHALKAAGGLAYTGVYQPFERVLVASYGAVMYVVKMIAPFRLSAIYPFPALPIEHLGPAFYLSFVALVVGLPLVVFFFRKDRPVLFGLAFFFINIVLVLQFLNFGTELMADRYTYLPYVGLFFALSAWLDERAPTPATSHPGRTLIPTGLMLLIPICAVQTWNRCEVWKNPETLWNDTIRKYPHKVVDAYNLRGHYYQHTLGRLDAAMADYDEALRLNPSNGHAWNNKGTLLSQMGHDDSALACFDRAVAAKPDLADAFNNRGAVKGRLGDLAGATSDFTRSIAIDPRFRDPYVNRSVAYFMLNQYESAIADSRAAIALDAASPDTPSLYDAIGTNLQAMNRPGDAIAEHTKAIQATPMGDSRLGGFHLNRSFAYLASGDRGNALQDAVAAEGQGIPVKPEYWKKLGVEPKP